jgi:hypothetical protein
VVQKFALFFGILYIVVGVLGFIPGIVQPATDHHGLAVEAGHGYLMGLFPINLLHNIVHLLVGALGVLGSRSVSGAVKYARGLAIFYGLLAVMGLFPVTNTMFGLVPIHGNDIWLHAVSALIAAYFGWMARDTVAQTRPA